MIKKILVVCLIIICILSFVGCDLDVGKNISNKDSKDGEDSDSNRNGRDGDENQLVPPSFPEVEK